MRLAANPFGALPPATRTLILASFACYTLGLFMGRWFDVYLGLVPALALHKFWLWQPFTYMFLHGSFFHIFFNLFSLWMFGSILENLWGTARFTRFYFVCGLGAAALYMLLNPYSLTPVIGASGAIYGLLAAFALEFPDAVVYLYFLFPVKARTMAIALCALEFAASFNPHSHIANLAHLGGLLTGLIYLRGGPWLARLRGGGQRLSLPHGSKTDAILEKIHKHGLSSLSERERRIIDGYATRLRD